MMVRRVLQLVLVLALQTGNSAWAQRDPTLPPFSGGSSGAANQAPKDTSPSWAVLVIDGQPHLVVGTKLYREGQQMGKARIERITETEIWLRQGGTVRKNAIFRGVVRRDVPAAGPCEAAVPGTGSAQVVGGKACGPK